MGLRGVVVRSGGFVVHLPIVALMVVKGIGISTSRGRLRRGRVGVG